MADKKLILVFGATGAQGGSVVDFLLKDGKYNVRAVTRNPDSDKANALKARGVEVVKGDLNDADTANLKKAFQGVYGVFAVTNFWDPASMGKETQQGILLADLAKEAGVKHYVWSTLPNVKEISNNKYNVPHFTDKALVDDHIKKIGLPTTYVAAGFYYQNFITFFPPRKSDDGTFVFTLGLAKDAKIAAFDVTDTGGVVVEVFNNPTKWLGKYIPLVGQNTTPVQYFQELQEATGKKIEFNSIPHEQFEKFGFPGAEELGQMFGFFEDYGFFGPNGNVWLGKEAYPKFKTWKEFVTSSGYSPQ